MKNSVFLRPYRMQQMANLAKQVDLQQEHSTTPENQVIPAVFTLALPHQHDPVVIVLQPVKSIFRSNIIKCSGVKKRYMGNVFCIIDMYHKIVYIKMSQHRLQNDLLRSLKYC